MMTELAWGNMHSVVELVAEKEAKLQTKLKVTPKRMPNRLRQRSQSRSQKAESGTCNVIKRHRVGWLATAESSSHCGNILQLNTRRKCMLTCTEARAGVRVWALVCLIL